MSNPLPVGPIPVGDDDLQAWLDGALPPARHAELAAWLDANPEAATRLRALASDREALRAALRPIHDEPIPARLRVAHLLAAQRRARLGTFRRIAAVCAWLALGGVAGWAGRSALIEPPPTRPMVAEALAAHHVFAADLRRPVEVAAEQDVQLVRWLSNRLGRSVPLPDLVPVGYRLMGGRLLPGAGGDPAAQLMYENAEHRRLTVYLRADRAGGGPEFRFADDPLRGASAFWWVDRGFGYAVSAEGIDRAALLRIAETVHRQVLRPL